MSLDVYLDVETPVRARRGSGIFIRESGGNREISREEWDVRFPGREPVVAAQDDEEETTRVYEANVTHNLHKMADEAGIGGVLWDPKENGITKAWQLVEPLTTGLARLRADPERFQALNPPNGWGTYGGLCAFVAGYLDACETHPDANVRVSR